jgi:hypothetical protein
MHEQAEVVFQEGVLSQGMTFTIRGRYRLRRKRLEADYACGDSAPWEFSTQECFSELSLFTKFFHTSTLVALTYADSFGLLLNDFIECIKASPVITATVTEYASAYLELFKDIGLASSPYESDDYITVEVGEQARRVTSMGRDAIPAHLQRQMSFFEDSAGSGRSLLPKADSIAEFVQTAMDHAPNSGKPEAGRLGEDWADHLERQIPDLLLELHATAGTYARLKIQGMQERQRAIGAILNAFFLLTGSYADFVFCQDPSSRMSHELWVEFQSVVSWAEMTPEMIHTALVFFAFRGLGKVQDFVDMCPPDCTGSPERALTYAMNELQESVPSVKTLPTNMFDLLEDTLKLHELFNFAQMLQGENIPWSISYLQIHINQHGEQALKFYIFVLVSMMSGLVLDSTKRGSKFMTETNGRNVLLAIKSLQRLGKASPPEM